MNDQTGEPNMDAVNSKARHSELSEPTDTRHIPEFESSGSSPGLAQTEKRKRGRPRKHANDAAKTAAYRSREQDKKEDAEHRKLVSWLTRRSEASLASAAKEISESSAHTIRAENRQYLKTFEDQLIGISIGS